MTAGPVAIATSPRPGWPRPTSIPLVVFVLVAIGLWAIVGIRIGPADAAIALAVLIGGGVAGAAIVSILFPRPSAFQLIVLGLTFGLALFALGGVLSHLTGLFAIRWVPSAGALLLWMLALRRPGDAAVPRSAPPWQLVAGSTVGTIGMLPLVRAATGSAPASWDGWYTLYVDLPFQSAIAAEVASRVPHDVPWVAGTTLSYTWTYHSAMGVWSSSSGVPVVDLVLQCWPVLVAILLPGVIALAAWEFSHSTAVAAAAPLVFVFVHGLPFSPPSFVQLPLFSLSPTRDFGDLLTVTVLVALARCFDRGGRDRLEPHWLIFLGLAMFVATGAKGSVLPILLGGVMCTIAIQVLRRRFTSSDLIVVGVFVVGAVAGFLSVLPDPGTASTLSWGPLTFVAVGVPEITLLSAVLVVAWLAYIAGSWFTITLSGAWLPAILLSGTTLAGLVGLTFLTQPGASQNYFWQGAEPVIAITTAWCGMLLPRRYGWRALAGAGLLIAVSTAAVAARFHPGLIAAATAILIVGVAVYLVRRDSRTGWWRRVTSGLAVAAVLIGAAQVAGIAHAPPGGAVSDELDPGAVHASQLAAFEYLRENSDPDDVVATNVHCRSGSIAGGDCDPRIFTLTAFSQRRVLVEGWGYTQYDIDSGWADERVAISDGFIADPTPAARDRLIDDGVRFIYVDTRLPWSDRLNEVAEPVFQSEFARVWRIA